MMARARGGGKRYVAAMTVDADRRAERAGGWSAVAAGLLPFVATGLLLASLTTAGGFRPDLAPAMAITAVLLAGAQAGVVLTADRRLRPASWVTRLGLLGGLAGALTWFAAGVAFLSFHGGAAAGVDTPRALAAMRTAGLLFEIAPVGSGVWALCAAAAAWRLRLWPAWLRVTGAVFGAAAMVQPGFPPLALIGLLAGVAWWFGLAVMLLRDPRRSTPG